MKFYNSLKDITIQDNIYPSILNKKIDKFLSNNLFNKIRWEQWLDVPVLHNGLLLGSGANIEGDTTIKGNANINTLTANNVNVKGDVNINGEATIGGESPLEMAYPIGSIYMSSKNKNPADSEILGFGDWERVSQGKVLVGDDPNDPDFDASINSEGGEKETTLSKSKLPSHSHQALIQGSTSSHRHDCKIITGGNSRSSRGGYNPIHTGSLRQIYTSQPVNSEEHVHQITTQETGFNEPHNNLQPYVVVHMWKRTN